MKKIEYITYVYGKDIAVLKKLGTTWLCAISQNGLEAHWTEGREYIRWDKGKFQSQADENNSLSCVCRNSTKEEIEQANQSLVITSL